MGKEQKLDDSAKRWGDPTLIKLDRWLITHGIPDVEAVGAVEDIWAFYSYDVLPTAGRGLRLGMVGFVEFETPDRTVFLDLLWPSESFPLAQMKQLSKAFDERAKESEVKFHLGHMRSTELWGGSLAQHLRTIYCGPGMEYIGIYRDNLKAELRLLLGDKYESWMNTPNTRFVGRKPKSLLYTPDDVLLRDFISEVSHGSHS